MEDRYSKICEQILDENNGTLDIPRYFKHITYIDENGFHVLTGAEIELYGDIPREIRMTHRQLKVQMDFNMMVADFSIECIYWKRLMKRIIRNLPD